MRGLPAAIEEGENGDAKAATAGGSPAAGPPPPALDRDALRL